MLVMSASPENALKYGVSARRKGGVSDGESGESCRPYFGGTYKNCIQGVLLVTYPLMIHKFCHLLLLANGTPNKIIKTNSCVITLRTVV